MSRQIFDACTQPFYSIWYVHCTALRAILGSIAKSLFDAQNMVFIVLFNSSLVVSECLSPQESYLLKHNKCTLAHSPVHQHSDSAEFWRYTKNFCLIWPFQPLDLFLDTHVSEWWVLSPQQGEFAKFEACTGTVLLWSHPPLTQDQVAGLFPPNKLAKPRRCVSRVIFGSKKFGPN